ncbi:MAG: SPOR domain-containing protein [Tannerella sp.]|nr:SPOR domain-containing protein [Tannerella sp.]
MLNISAHIERLLWDNDCVIIPDLGGFILQNQPAVYAEGVHTFYPPRKEIVFNPALRHDDGLLSESYMQTCGMTFREARLALKKDIDDLKTGLDEQKHVALGKIGSFRKGEEGGYIFLPGIDTPLFCVNSYGLDMFHLSPVPDLTGQTAELPQPAKPDRKTGRVRYLPVYHMVFRSIGITAAATALFLWLSPPVNEVNPTSYTAGFLLPEILSKPLISSEQPDSTCQFPEKQTAASEPVATDTVTQPVVTVAQQPPAVPDRATTYYIIIASFLTEKQAEKYLVEINPSECKETGIVKQNENIRVYAARYTNRKEAETYMHQLRANDKFKNAWLFIHREIE